MNNRIWLLAVLLTTLFKVEAQGTAFTYQGRLNDSANPASGHYDLQFILFNVNQFGFPIGPILTNANVAVNNGLFTTTLDFGPAIFAGTNYWLEISVRTNGNGAFSALTPRQPITPTPYAVFAENVRSGGIASGTYTNAVTFNNRANNFSGGFTGDGAAMTNVNAARLGGLSSSDFWQIGGNAGTSADFIGTTDNQPFDIKVNNVRAMRYRLGADPNGFYTNAPNVIGGSPINSALTTIVGATIGGGGGNYTRFGGAELDNRTTADFATVSGGAANTSGGFAATVGGGESNIANDDYATVGGGYGSTAGYSATVGGGYNNIASGMDATIPGGFGNTAGGDDSFAAGTHARADHQGSFVWGDSNDFDFHSAVVNQFAVRCTGGAKFVTAIDNTGAQTAGVRLGAGDTAWSTICDRNAKKNFQPVNSEMVLDKLAAVPVQQWNYKWESDTNTPHLGPMAQDFKATFYPGRDDKSISTLEFDGVELAAIQGLNQKLEEQLRAKDASLTALERRNASLEQRLERLEKLLNVVSAEKRSPE